jgi:polyhydroxybutyrate depolymerase
MPGLAYVLIAATVTCCAAVVGVPHAAADPGGDVAGRLSFGGLERTYLVHAPAGIDHPTGLVINLHGTGGSGGEQAAATNYDSAADGQGFVVVYPDGVDRSWADQLVHQYGIDPGRVFATGMSAGGFMVNRLACDRADVIAAIAPVSGTLGAGVACNPSQPVAVLQTHGADDPVVPYHGGTMHGRGGDSQVVGAPEMSSRWRALDRCPAPPVRDVLPSTGDGTTVHRTTSGGCADGTEVVLMRVDGGGHQWPSGTPPHPKDWLGKTTNVFDASLSSAQFFAAHGR